MITNLSEHASALDEYMRALRDVEIQGDRERFRRNIRKIGQVVGFEVSKSLTYRKETIQTPLARMDHRVLADDLVVVTILRAGLPFHEGLLDAFPNADNGFISAYRKHGESGFEIESKYLACPSLEGKVLLLNDPMLATGSSFETALHALAPMGKPSRIILSAVIASEEGIENLKRNLKMDFDLWVAAVDPSLNKSKYIVPGLGDAGDLSFGEKLQN